MGLEWWPQGPNGEPGLNMWQLCHDVNRHEPELAAALRAAGVWPDTFVDEEIDGEDVRDAAAASARAAAHEAAGAGGGAPALPQAPAEDAT